MFPERQKRKSKYFTMSCFCFITDSRGISVDRHWGVSRSNFTSGLRCWSFLPKHIQHYSVIVFYYKYFDYILYQCYSVSVCEITLLIYTIAFLNPCICMVEGFKLTPVKVYSFYSLLLKYHLLIWSLFDILITCLLLHELFSFLKV